MKRLLIIGTMVALAACSADADGASQGDEDDFFTGTPDEFWQLMIACYDEHGIQARQEGSSLGVESTLDTEDFILIEEECLSRIPRMPEPDEISENQLRRMHTWRVEQYECMVDNGYLSGEPLSFEEYLDHNQETNSDWSAMNELNQTDMLAALNTCPQPTDEW